MELWRIPVVPTLQEAIKNSKISWQKELESLFDHAKDRFPDVVWELIGDDEEPSRAAEEVYGHKAVIYARAPPSFQDRYFSFRPLTNGTQSPASSSSLGGADSSLSFVLPDHPTGGTPRTPSPYHAPSTIVAPSIAPPTLLRLTTSMNPTIFSSELEYLYTGKGFGEIFECLFDEESTCDPEALRVAKLRKDLVFMWRSYLYSDIRISVTGDFGGSDETKTALFSSHRFILVSRSTYFCNALLVKSALERTDAGIPIISLPCPPVTPASLHFTLGFIYTGTLAFSQRSYDLSTAFAILRTALYLDIPTLHDEIQARIAQEMVHGLFHAFITFNEYERLTAGRWGTGGCRCRQCARRVPRVLEFSLAEDVRNIHLERGARRALVGLFGEGWCNSEFASLHQRNRNTTLVALGRRTTVQNSFPLLFAAERALSKLANQTEPWSDTVKDMILTARTAIDDVIAMEAEACFNTPEWVEIMENDGVRLEDRGKVEWVMGSVLRGVKEIFAPSLYQTLVSILCRPHPTEVNGPHLFAVSHIRVQVEQTRLDLLKWIGHRWLAIKQERGFDLLEGWALKEISDHIEVSVEDLFNPPTDSKTSPTVSGASIRGLSGLRLRPILDHPRIFKVGAHGEDASGVHSRSLALREQLSSASTASTIASVRTSVRGSVRSTVKSNARRTTSRITTAVTPQANKGARKAGPRQRAVLNEIEARDKVRERPDKKLAPSTVKPDDHLDEEESGGKDFGGTEEPDLDMQRDEERSNGDDPVSPNENPEDPMEILKLNVQDQTPVKVLAARASVANVKSAARKPSDSRLRSSSALRSHRTLSSVASGPASSMRVGLLNRNLALIEPSRDAGPAPSRSPVESTTSDSTVPSTPQANEGASKDGPRTISSSSSYGSFTNQGQHASGQGTINNMILNHTTKSEQLEKHCSHNAAFDSAARFDPPRCTESTRLGIIQIVDEWINSDGDNASLFWLCGGAGVGKSALAQSLSEKYQERKQLAASFFFFRSDALRNNGKYLIPTIVSHLVCTFKGIIPLVEDRIRENPGLFTKRSQTQIQELLVEPLITLKSTGCLITQPCLLVIDGLDECENADVQCELLRVIAVAIRQVPYPLRFLVTSRPEAHITHVFDHERDLQAIPVHRYNLSDDPDADMDIRKFLEKEFDEIRRVHRLGRFLPQNWPDRTVIPSIVERSSGHFIYASTVIRYIQSPNHRPDDRLEVILHLRPPQEGDRPYAQLDGLYSLIFEGVTIDSQLEKICLVLGILYLGSTAGDFAKFRAYSTIEALLEMKAGDLVLLLDPILALVAIDGDQVRILHKSLFDYLLTRGGHLPFNLARVHESAATYILKQNLVKNSCTIHDFRYFAYHCQYAYLSDVLKDYLHSLEVPYPASVMATLQTFPPRDEELFHTLQSMVWYFLRTLSREDFDSTGQVSEQYMAKWIDYYNHHSVVAHTISPSQTEAVTTSITHFQTVGTLLDELLTEWNPRNFNPKDTAMEPVGRVAFIKQQHSVFPVHAQTPFSGNTSPIASSLLFGDHFIHSYNIGSWDNDSYLVLQTYSKHDKRCYQQVFICDHYSVVESAKFYLVRAEKYLFSDLYQNYGLEPE